MVKFNGKIIPLAHTLCASSAFLTSLLVACTLHYNEIVKKSIFQQPYEYFGSIWTVIGGLYPEKDIFRGLLALSAILKFLLILGHYYLSDSIATLIVGTARTTAYFGCVYIANGDGNDIHDLTINAYIILTLLWDVCIIRSSEKLKIWRKLTFVGFFCAVAPLIIPLVQRRIHVIPTARDFYFFFGWASVVFDITFDAISVADFSSIEIGLGLNSFQIQDSSKPAVNGPKHEKNHENSGLIEVQSYIYLLSNTFNSFVFWTALTSLTCSIWYFPLWHMGISGYEGIMLCDLSPIILYIPYVPRILRRTGTLLGGLITVGSYFIALPENRLLATGAGCGILTATFVLSLKSSKTPEANSAFTITWLFGLVISVILKFACFGNNPLWPITKDGNGGHHKVGLFVTLVFGLLAPYVNPSNFTPKSNSNNSPSSSKNIGYKISVALGWGSILFTLHHFFTDASTLIYWSWEGWNQETQGPLAWPWGALTCFVMLLATLTSLNFSKSLWLPGSILLGSTWVLCSKNISEWQNYLYGGLPYTFSIIWLIPSYFIALSELESYGVIILGIATYMLISFGSVWTIAYPFVPLGWLFRERIDAVVWFSTVLILLGALVIKVPSDTITSIRSEKLGNSFFKHILVFFFFITTLIGGFTFQNRPTGLPQPYHPDSQMITAGIWTVHFGFDNDMWASEESMAFLFESMELDVVGLLETDTQHIPMGNRDITSKLTHDLNMYADYGPGPNKHTWGCVLLSKFPIVNSTHHLLPSPVGEIAPAIHATLKTYNDTLVDVFVFHSGQEEDILDRQLQTEGMTKLMGSTQRPTILLSYLVTDPHEGNYNSYVSDMSGMRDIDPNDNERWCEYILYKKLKKLGYARVTRGEVTDTELQVGKFQVLPESQVEEMGEDLYDTVTVDAAERDDHLFPEKFFDEGQRGHRYHVFNRPRYFSLK